MKKLVSALLFVMAAVYNAAAQPLPPPPPNQAISLDLVVAILIITGAVYGATKLWNNRNRVLN